MSFDFILCFFLKTRTEGYLKESDNRSPRVLANPIAIPTYPAYMVTIFTFPTYSPHSPEVKVGGFRLPKVEPWLQGHGSSTMSHKRFPMDAEQPFFFAGYIYSQKRYITNLKC